jgi:hypothetical protein
MKFNQLEGFAFDNESKSLGAIAGVNFVKQTMEILTDEEEVVVAKLENVVFLEEIGYIGNEGIINHDVVMSADGKLFEIELQEDGKHVQLHLLDKGLNRTELGDSILKEDLSVLAPYVELVGNKFELEPEEDETLDFNIRIVRTHENGEFGYSYACNNIAKEEIDLIKVLFIGHKLLEEKAYERVTVSHEEYIALVESGKLKEVSPNELMNYVTGMTYNPSSEVEAEYNDNDEEDENLDNCDCYECRMARGEDVDEDYCDECGEQDEDCDCKGW